MISKVDQWWPPRFLALVPVFLVLSMLTGVGPVSAKLLTITDIPRGISDDLPYGEIVREIRIEGNNYTREWVIRMSLKSQVGFPYTKENAKQDLLYISRLGAFTSVSFSTEPAPDGIALIVTVVEGSPYIPSISIALTQENGFEIGPAVSSSNFLGTASRASLYARFGGATNIGIKYADPQIPGRSILFGHRFEYFHRERANNLLDFQETTDEVFYEFRQPTSNEMRTGIRFRYLALQSDKDDITLSSDDYDHIPSLGFFVQNDSRNSVYPTNGWYIDAEVAKYGIFGGDSDYWRLDLDFRRYIGLPFIGEKHSMSFSTFTSLVAGELGVNVPFHQEFFVGGTNSVRGWSLGARQGKNQWLNTVEYWYRLMDQKAWKIWFLKWRMGFQVGVFGDFGTAWADYQDLETNMIAGGGVGFRLTMPVITMVRFDLAYGEQDISLRVYIGGGEKAEAQKKRVR